MLTLGAARKSPVEFRLALKLLRAPVNQARKAGASAGGVKSRQLAASADSGKTVLLRSRGAIRPSPDQTLMRRSRRDAPARRLCS